MYRLLIEYGYMPPSNITPYFETDFSVFMDYYTIRECQRIFDAHRSRSSRVRKRISLMLEKPCIFLTLTFTDEMLSNTQSSTRRRYIVGFLSQFGVPCIANKDFGKLNGREHYHALIQISNIDYSLYDYGAINGKRVVQSSDTDIKLSKYISKLTNHAIKETTKNSRIIYLHMDQLYELDDPIQLKF